MVRFLHTADWHLGMKYAQLGPKADRAREIRMETVERLLKIAKEKNVDFILVAGDTFDSNEVDSNTIRELCADLSKTALPVYILPGNHDPLTRDSPYNDPLWDEVENVRILKKAKPLEIGDNVTLYPCPVRQKQSRSDPTSWINPEGNGISIGVAHGNLDFTKNTNFPINPETDLDYLALGEWHSFFQIGCTVYPGTPETTKFGEAKSGNIVIVNLDKGCKPEVEAVKTGQLKWESPEFSVNSIEDVKNLENSFSDKNLVLNLKLRGVVGQDSFNYLENLKMDDLFFFNLETRDLYLKPSMLEFQAMIPDGSYLPKTFRALTALMKQHPETGKLSDMSREEAREIFRELNHTESVEKASPEVLKRALLLLYQMVKEVSQ